MNRPTAVTVLGVWCIVVGVLNICSMPLGIWSAYVTLHPDAAPYPMPRIELGPAMIAWMYVGIVWGLFLAILKTTNGVGLLRMKPWARVSSLVYAVLAIITVVANAATTFYLMPQLMSMSAHPVNHQTSVQLSGNTEVVMGFGEIGGMVGASFGLCMGLVLPIALLVILTRPAIKEAFRHNDAFYDETDAADI